MLNSCTTTILKRGIRRGSLTLWRERQWMTALGALFGVFLLVQLLILVLTGLEGVQVVLKNRTDLHLKIIEQATDNDIQTFLVELQNQSFVRNTAYITKEKAFEQARVSDPNLIAFLEEYSMKNPFADSIKVTLRDLDNYNQFSDYIEQERWRSVVDPEFLSQITDQEKQVHALLSITTAVRSLTILILIITAAALIFIVTELVRRRAMGRSNEVLVERLVGATPFSITIPFITEATILLFIAIVMSTAVMLLIASLLPLYIPALAHNGILGPLRQEIKPLMTTLLPTLLLIETALIPILATVGAWLGVRPQVHSPRIAYTV